ncbi:MAG: VOC family protein [Chloroflexota bacterium]
MNLKKVPVLALDHTAIAVRSIESALPLYRDLLGGEPFEYSQRPSQSFHTMVLHYPNGAAVELIAPLGETGFVQDFLSKRGEGVHHLTYLVADIRASVQAARAAGFRVVGEDFSRPEWSEAFISPRDAHGTIVQLAQTNLSTEARHEFWHPRGFDEGS